MLKVHEIFKSIQGEGIDIGMPMVFVRFAGCNLACEWCDTTYASRSSSQAKRMAYMQVIQEIEKFGEMFGVTLTGGEPLIQDKEQLDWLIYELKGRGYFINIETNGVFLPDLQHGKLVDRFSISPKLASSGNKSSINYTTLSKYLEEYSHKIFFKFVISNKIDFFEMGSILNKLENFREKNIPVVVQPNIDDKSVKSIKKQNKKFLDLLKIMDEIYPHLTFLNRIRIIPQFHKYLWADKKGV